MVKFWGNILSQPSRSVEFVLKKFGVEYEYVHTEFKTDTRSEDYLKNVNSRGELPVLGVDGTNITQSAAILRYLCDTYDTSESLLPKSDLVARAQVDAWFDISGTEYRPSFTKAYTAIVLNPVFAGADKPSEEEAKALIEGVLGSFKDLEKNLGEAKYLTGDSLRIVDIVIFNEILTVCTLLKLDTNEYEKLHAWRATVREEELVADLEEKFHEKFALLQGGGKTE
mmetsp:Transcript_1062/g.933  ORF Transcript_1062/g.933 Transcript_1062/m.933 type:complete len:226 (+) Transcript_1062:15-692(+)